MTRDEWLQTRTFGAPPDLGTLLAAKAASGQRIAVVIPAREVAHTIGTICRAIHHTWMVTTGLVDELVVVDASSADGSAAFAAAAGARVIDEAGFMADIAATGKGAAMWKGLAATTSELVVWIDGDIEGFEPAFVPTLVAPLLADPQVQYVKGFFDRVYAGVAGNGGRVSEICARPLINRFRPALAGVIQPLAGEAAGRRTLLEQLPFFSGYAVEIGLLWDIHSRVGLEGMAQVDLGTRAHRNQRTSELGPMAHAITEAVLRRERQTPDTDATLDYARPMVAGDTYTLTDRPIQVVELPPLATIPPEARR